jgi:hypothetical protein
MDSLYQTSKLYLLDLIPISRDAFHVYIGMTIFLIFFFFCRSSKISWKLLIPVFVVSILLECVDLVDDAMSIGSMRIGASFHDIINTNLIPALTLLILKIKEKKD